MEVKNIKQIDVGGVLYPVIFSVSTLEVIEAEFGDLEHFDGALSDGNGISALGKLIRVIRSMIVDAETYIQYAHLDIPCPEVPPEHIFKIVINPAQMQSTMMQVIAGDRSVIAEPVESDDEDNGSKKKEN